MRTARDYRLPYGVMVGARESGWSDKDRLLALALTMHEDGLHSCGHPKSLAFSADSDGIWEVVTHVCEACAAVQNHKQASEGRKPMPGEGFGVANTLRDDEAVRMWQPSARGAPDLVEPVRAEELNVQPEGL